MTKIICALAKLAATGLASATLTNPLNVTWNKMIKTNKLLPETVKLLHEELGYSFLTRGLGKNMVAVAIPVHITLAVSNQLGQLGL
jgi:hypothetical protein